MRWLTIRVPVTYTAYPVISHVSVRPEMSEGFIQQMLNVQYLQRQAWPTTRRNSQLNRHYSILQSLSWQDTINLLINILLLLKQYATIFFQLAMKS